MKKIYNILLTSVALLAFAPFAGAQSRINDVCADPETGEAPVFPEDHGTYTTGNNVGYNKVISKPQTDGTYWIKLEAFATGEASIIQASVPSDCVLVLDLSSSMDEDYVTKHPALPEQVYTYNNYPTGGAAHYYYKHTDGNYYEVQRGSGQGGYYLRYTVGNTRWYLSGNSSTTTNTRFPNADDTIFTGVLYEAGRSYTRLEALQEACVDFVENLYTNAQQSSAVDPSFAGNRLAIVTYSGDKTPVNNTSYIEDATQGWKNVTTDRASLESSINGFNLQGHSGTRPDLGLKMVVDNYASSVREGANFTVLVFTDGYPVQSYNNPGQIYMPTDGNGNTIGNYYGTGATRFTCLFADDAIHYAHVLKDTYKATVFSVGLIETVAQGNTQAYQNYRRVLYQMDMISSNYPDSDIALGTDVPWSVANNTYEVTVNGLTTGTKDPEGNYFQLVDENTDLSTIFKQISEMSGGTASELNSATTTVDVVSSSFLLPENAVSSDIKLFTAKCTNSSPWAFEREYLKGTSPYYTYNDDGSYSNVKVDASLAASIEGNKITVSGFEYSKNWCGPVTSGSTVTYRGYKVIILIPIRMNPDAVGGPNVDTNGPGSGIIDENGNNVMPFTSPHVSLPVNVYIEKVGLQARESAKFRIERAQIPASGNIEDVPEGGWEYVSTVFVTNSPYSSHTDQGNPMVRVKGMPATEVIAWEDEDGDQQEERDDTHTIPVQVGLIYKISEEPWSWSYTPKTPPQYTVTDKVDNPFKFTNEKRTTENIDVTVRHAESKATNVFKGSTAVGTGILYDDSKKNTGREDYYEPPTWEAASGEGEGGESGGTGTGTGD